MRRRRQKRRLVEAATSASRSGKYAAQNRKSVCAMVFHAWLIKLNPTPPVLLRAFHVHAHVSSRRRERYIRDESSTNTGRRIEYSEKLKSPKRDSKRMAGESAHRVDLVFVVDGLRLGTRADVADETDERVAASAVSLMRDPRSLMKR
ncbi:hypothetical protein BN2476_350009 [Paraburkholderia piptadeniae]|uniref:Uncharacterized protein n=2 Tax=Paraburkholderia piptadeniae TaxID=1701573 RepID=A0A1N7S7E4_9BURK|nr:hypothetical protein BN2476_350009 [Paraburkholderia piptadeniae]